MNGPRPFVNLWLSGLCLFRAQDVFYVACRKRWRVSEGMVHLFHANEKLLELVARLPVPLNRLKMEAPQPGSSLSFSLLY
ncbi:hypothetical protein BC830DRAFT_1135771 [Chytriomyces sp. MP71]|nr:hypothetical protein BC830DRAFT_1135771 [Chytriomyces sp. MP71]